MSYRSDVVNAAIKEWKAHPEGRPALYWREVLNPYDPTYAADWCGAFVLRSLKQAGLAKNAFWDIGIGFISPQGLQQTSDPQPGDIAFFAEPFGHQSVIVSYEPTTGMITSIDGNQPGILAKVRFRNANTSFYSIQPFIDQAEASASSWPFVVAGVAIVGAAAWVWMNGLPKSIDRAIKRLAA